MSRSRRRRPQRSRFGAVLSCDVCGVVWKPGLCRPFSLTTNLILPDGKRTTRSYGSIDLCILCWGRVASDRCQKLKGEGPFHEVDK